MSTTSDILKEINEINHELVEKLRKLSELSKLKDSEEKTRNLKINEILQAKVLCLKDQNDLESLSERNKAIRDKCSEIDESLKLMADKINEETKSYFKYLGIKVHIADYESRGSSLEIKLDFLDNDHFFIKFIYDLDTDDFDLIEIFPEHKNFTNIKKFLRQTGDIQGLLYCLWSYKRKYFSITIQDSTDCSR